MPELPEVETTRRGIAPYVVGELIVAASVYDARLRWPVPQGLEHILVGRTLLELARRSKYLLFTLTGGTLLMHFGMTGSLRVFTDLPRRRTHDHVDLRFANGVTLRYHDPRRFGAILWIEGEPAAHRLLSSLGPEPLAGDFEAGHLYDCVRSRRSSIKQALMDSSIVVGIGNIYANESLFRAGIHPTRAANRVGRARLAGLIEAVRATLNEAIQAGGSTLRDYVDGLGQSGSFQLDYFVYGRAGQPCRLCATPIRVVRLGGRASFYCPRCQH